MTLMYLTYWDYHENRLLSYIRRYIENNFQTVASSLTTPFAWRDEQ